MLQIIGAYGRNYKSIEAALIDWNAGKDFKVISGPYCSIRDIEAMKRDFGGVNLIVGMLSHKL